MGTAVARTLTLALLLTTAAVPAGPLYRALPGGPFVSSLRGADGAAVRVTLAPFAMRATLVTQAEFLRFVQAAPAWRKDRILPLLASDAYLQDWPDATTLPADRPADAPVTQVSWFAARAFCASEGGELPSWNQWEYAAAADARQPDARQDPARNGAILAREQARAGRTPPAVGNDPPNVYGLHDLQGLVWEWVADYAALFARPDTREEGRGATLALCGGSALAFEDRQQYALIMRVAALTALRPADGTAHLGFRCVRPSGDPR